MRIKASLRWLSCSRSSGGVSHVSRDVTEMSFRRALVDCVVLSVQDACVFYPCCKGCLSRMDFENQYTRWRCSRCGYSCVRDLVDYRYRLSLRVARDRSLFGVTVFGTCLNPFFGTNASTLQKLVANFDGPVEASARSTLLLTAVKDCFVGRRFIFGLKVTDKENWPWLSGPVVNESSRKDTAQVIATQMVLPKALGLEGCTVVSYYEVLLQKAAEHELGSTCRPPGTTQLLIAHHSPASSFNKGAFFSSGLSPQTLLRAQDEDYSLIHTPPWQQSLGLVTSSAEQEDSCCTQDVRDGTSREVDNFRTPHCAQRLCREDNEGAQTSVVLSPPLPLELNSCSHSSSARRRHASFEEAFRNTPIFNTYLSSAPPCHNCSETESSSTGQPDKAFSPSSEAWEDLPFSESLTAFLYEENKIIGDLGETTLNPNQTGTGSKDLEIGSHNKQPSLLSTPVCQSSTQITDRRSQTLLDITTKSAPTGGGKLPVCELERQAPAGSVCKSPARNLSSHEWNEDEKVGFLSFRNAEEQLEGNSFDCSADLFSETMGTPDVTLRSEKVPPSPTDTHKLTIPKCIKRYSLIPGAQEVDFVPPSQSTPVVKLAAGSRRPAALQKSFPLDEFGSQPDGLASSAFHRKRSDLEAEVSAGASCYKLDCGDASQVRQSVPEEKRKVGAASCRHSHRLTPTRRSWKPNGRKNHLMAQREALNRGSIGGVGSDSRQWDCKGREEMIIPPTPGAIACQRVKLRRRNQTDKSNHLGHIDRGPGGDRVHLKRTRRGQILVSSRRPAQTGRCDREAVDEESRDGCNRCLPDDEDEAGDWSRDLFSDSI